MEYKKLSKKNHLISCPPFILIKNLLIGYFVSFILFLILAFIITYTDLSLKFISPLTITIILMSILFVSILNGLKSDEKGWLTGAITGLLYMLILYIIGSVIYKNLSITSNGVMMIMVGIITGITGSIIGINNKKNYKTIK